MYCFYKNCFYNSYFLIIILYDRLINKYLRKFTFLKKFLNCFMNKKNNITIIELSDTIFSFLLENINRTQCSNLTKWCC